LITKIEPPSTQRAPPHHLWKQLQHQTQTF
jgi:hypothetical protein